MNRSEKVSYVQKQIASGFSSYYGLSAASVNQLDDDRLDIEYDCAKHWAGDE